MAVSIKQTAVSLDFVASAPAVATTLYVIQG